MVARQSDKCRSIFRFSPILYGKKHMGIATRAYRDSRAAHVVSSFHLEFHLDFHEFLHTQARVEAVRTLSAEKGPSWRCLEYTALLS